jgi:DHA3 family tetracycline resistance protein-like MFS transporter
MRTRDARVVYLALQSATALLHTTTWTTAAVYLINVAHLGALQLVLLGTIMEASIFVFEIPTGVLADTAGRRRSVIIGTLVMGSATVLTGSIPWFPALLASQALWGLGETFTSGATAAWLAGEVGDRAAGPLFLRAAQYQRVAAAVGIGLAVGLANLGLGLPLIAGGAIQIALGGWLVGAMPETGFRRGVGEDRGVGGIGDDRAAGQGDAGERLGWRELARTALDGLAAARGDRVLVALLAVAVLVGASTEGIDRLWELHLLRGVGFPAVHLSAVSWFGIIQMVSLALGAAVIAPVRRRLDTTDPAALCRLLLALTAVEAAGLAAFGAATGFGPAVVAFLGYDAARGLRDPLYDAWVVPMIEPRVRATVLSTIGQADAVGETLGGPAIGLIATLATPGAAIVAAGAALVPAIALLANLLPGRRGRAPAHR